MLEEILIRNVYYSLFFSFLSVLICTTQTFGQTKGVSLAQSVYVMHIKIHFKQALG